MAKDRDEVEAWYRRHGPALLLFGAALTRDRARAQDALHQVFLRLLENPELAPAGDARTYLFAALRNTIIDDAKRRNRDVPFPFDDQSWFQSSAGVEEEISLKRALVDLPADQREVLVLHIWGGLTFSQTAEVLAINPNTAAARYRYALAKLRGSLSVAKGEDVRAQRD